MRATGARASRVVFYWFLEAAAAVFLFFATADDQKGNNDSICHSCVSVVRGSSESSVLKGERRIILVSLCFVVYEAEFRLMICHKDLCPEAFQDEGWLQKKHVVFGAN